MERSKIEKFLNQIYPVKEEILIEYLSHWNEYQLPKKTIMTSEGETERYIYFVLEGIQKAYYIHNGKQHIIAFAYAPSVSGIPESFLTQTPSKFFLETITESKFLRISYEKHQKLMGKHRDIETLFRITTEQFLVGVIQRHYELMAFDIETRFRVFSKRSAHLFTMIAQKDLASYLRIDSTNFSKLMNKIQI